MSIKAKIASIAVALGIFAGSAQAATFLEGTFEVFINNYNAGGSSTNARATEDNLFGAGSGVDTVVTYTGALDFGIGGGNSSTTTIFDFFASGSGVVTGLDAIFGDLILSTPTFQNTTIFGFQSVDLGAFVGNIRHDDGIQFLDNGILENDRPAPTTVVNTAFDFSGGLFQLVYAAANGNPSVFEVTGQPVAPVPLPAALPLMLFGLGGLAAVRRSRRKT